MKNKKIYSFTLILLVTLTIGFGQKTKFNASAAVDPTKPVFIGFTAEGYGDTNIFNFNEKTKITVEYRVGRYAGVDGVNIYGSGSGLNNDPTEGLALNFSYNLKQHSYYKGTFTLKNATLFKGYAWIDNIDNGKTEDTDVFNHLEDWHYLYVNEEGTPPAFFRVINASSIASGVYRATANKTEKPVMIVYREYGGTKTDVVTLVTSVYRDIISDPTLNVFEDTINLIRMNFSVETETYVEFNATINFTDRTLYFCANNSYGWDSWSSSNQLKNALQIKTITNGYDFYSQPTFEEKFTDVDSIRLNITALNTTDIESFGISYYVQKSAENDTEIVPWTEVDATLNQTYSEINDNDNTDIIREYLVSLGKLNAGNILCYEAYNIYYGEIYNETDGRMHKLTIQNSKPSLSLHPLDNSYHRQENITFWYEADYVRGEIINATLDFGDGSPIEILGSDEGNITSHTYSKTNDEYTATLNVTLNIIRETEIPILVSNTTFALIYLDFIPPNLSITAKTNNTRDIVDGYVELYLDYSDDYTGIFRVWVFWGDGTVQNATDDTFIYHYYTNSSTYTITIMAEDRAGNQFNVTIIYSVVLPEPIIITPTPFALLPVIISVLLLGYSYQKKKSQKNK